MFVITYYNKDVIISSLINNYKQHMYALDHFALTSKKSCPTI